MNLEEILLRRSEEQMATTDWREPMNTRAMVERRAREQRGWVPRGCSVEGCEGMHWAKGLCRIHYKRQWNAARQGRAS